MSQKLDLSYPYGKFWRGIVRWSRNGEIDLSSENGISQVNALLKVICHSPAFDCYDGDFNGLSLDAVVNSLNIDLDAEEYHSDYQHSYRIEHITSFERVLKYRKYAPDWCILQSEFAYDEHAGYGKNHIYFCVRDDMERIPAFPGKEYPYDEYGYSLIAVITGPDSKIISITSRWNYGDDENDDFLTREQLQELLYDKMALII